MSGRVNFDNVNARVFDAAGFNREVGIRIRLARKRERLTQAMVADALDIPRATFANVECGRQHIAVDLLWRIAIVLAVPLGKLIPEQA